MRRVVVTSLALLLVLTGCAADTKKPGAAAPTQTVVVTITPTPGNSAAPQADSPSGPAAAAPAEPAAATVTDDQLLDAVLPGATCGNGDTGWTHTAPIRLSRGKGSALAADGSFDGAGVTDAKVIGRADIDGNGRLDVIMSFTCFGSLPEQCCAGQSSMMTFVGVFDPSRAPELTLVAPVIRGGVSGPGDSSGPAHRTIREAWLEGTTIATTEFILYAQNYSASQVGGDPSAPRTARYVLSGGAWQGG